jgi:hypothetical protein
MIDRVHWIDKEKPLTEFILNCQLVTVYHSRYCFSRFQLFSFMLTGEWWHFRQTRYNAVDIYHTYFGGLQVLLLVVPHARFKGKLLKKSRCCFSSFHTYFGGLQVLLLVVPQLEGKLFKKS